MVPEVRAGGAVSVDGKLACKGGGDVIYLHLGGVHVHV